MAHKLILHKAVVHKLFNKYILLHLDLNFIRTSLKFDLDNLIFIAKQMEQYIPINILKLNLNYNSLG